MSQRSEEHTSELQSPCNLVCRLLLEKKQTKPPRCRRCSAGARRGRRYPTAARVVARSQCCSIPVSFCDPRTRRLASLFFFFNDTATTEIYTLSLHDALPISGARKYRGGTVLDSCPCLWRS